MAIRITRSIRDDIVLRAMMKTFDPRQEQIDIAEHKLAFEAYRHTFKKDLEAVDKVPSSWFCSKRKGNFNCFGPRITLEFGQNVKFPNAYAWSNNQHEPVTDRDLAARILDHANARDTLKKEREAAAAALHALIMSCGTVKRLGEHWPEGHEFYKHIKDDNPPKLPTLQVGTVNAMLGL